MFRQRIIRETRNLKENVMDLTLKRKDYITNDLCLVTFQILIFKKLYKNIWISDKIASWFFICFHKILFVINYKNKSVAMIDKFIYVIIEKLFS